MASAERKMKPTVLSNPTFFFTCEEKRRLMAFTGKAPQRVNAQTRHKYHEHSAFSDPT